MKNQTQALMEKNTIENSDPELENQGNKRDYIDQRRSPTNTKKTFFWFSQPEISLFTVDWIQHVSSEPGHDFLTVKTVLECDAEVLFFYNYLNFCF